MSKILTGIGLIAAMLATTPALAQTAPAAPAAGTATLTINIRNLKYGHGSAVVALYSNAGDWSANNVQFRKEPATGRNIDVVYTGLAPGTYAAKIFYDINDNGRADPGEPVAYTNNAGLNETGGEPAFSDASFQVNAGANVKQTVALADAKINRDR